MKEKGVNTESIRLSGDVRLHDSSIERIVLATFLKDKEILQRFQKDITTAELFNTTYYKMIWNEISLRGVTDSKLMEYNIGEDGISQLIDQIASEKAIGDPEKLLNYIDILKNYLTRRSAYSISKNVLERLGEEKFASTLLTEMMINADKAIAESISGVSDGPSIIENSTKSIMDGALIIETGLPFIDDPAGGFTRGEISSFGARPGHGKTTLMVNLIKSLAELDYKLCVFNREMLNSQCIEKLILLHSQKLSYRRDLRQKQLADWVIEEIKVVSQNLKKVYYNLYMYDQIYDVDRTVQIVNSLRPDVFFDDYIQVTKVKNSSQDRRFQIEEIMTKYKQLVKKTLSSCVVLSQMNREVEKRVKPIPTLADYAEGATIEHASENCAFLFYGHKIDHEMYPEDSLDLIYRKTRYGVCGTYEIQFEGDKSTLIPKL